MNSADNKKVLVTGGGGYVGSVLIPKLLDAGYETRVLDLFIYGESVFDQVKDHKNLMLIKGDIRNQTLLSQAFADCNTIIHLACISNDPCFELNPDLGKSINYDAFEPMVQIAKDSGVSRFIFASSSSVYGVKEEENTTEDLPLNPLTDYSKYKALCEDILLKYQSHDFTTAILRPATVCGYSPRQRFDVIVNILTNHAVNTGKIRIFGGEQKRPNIHIEDMTDLYLKYLTYNDEQIAGTIYNAGYENHRVRELAEMVQQGVGKEVDMVVEPTDDIRSYHISSERIAKNLGFYPKHTILDAVRDMVDAFNKKRYVDSMNNPLYFNIKRMKEIELK